MLSGQVSEILNGWLVGLKSFYQLCLFHWGVAVTGATSPEMETVLFYFNSKGIFTL